MKFNTKKELAERLIVGEKWRVVGGTGYCFYIENEDCSNPFRYGNTKFCQPILSIWSECNGETEWEQVIDKPKTKTKTVWFWKVKDVGDDWEMTRYMCSEKELKVMYDNEAEYVRLDILGSEEVEV